MRKMRKKVKFNRESVEVAVFSLLMGATLGLVFFHFIKIFFLVYMLNIKNLLSI